MPKTVGIGLQDFRKIRDLNAFYIDKTKFIPEWWESKDEVTLITRPRRFGKTLMMSTVDNFFSVDHADGTLFESLEVWNRKEYRKLQGTYPVIMLSFSDIKENSYQEVRIKYARVSWICIITTIFWLRATCLTKGKRSISIKCPLICQTRNVYFIKETQRISL